MSGERRAARTLAALLLPLVLGAAACDNIVKRIPWFAAMVDGPAVETYEERPRPPAEGAMPVQGTRGVPLRTAAADLTNPLTGTGEQVERGRRVYRQFCLPCHGEAGDGRGPVVNADGDHPRRLPFTPNLDLTSGTPLERSDGYIWGMIENGRPPLMPSYRRVPRRERWYVVEYVRHLQRRAREEGAGPAAGGGGPEEGR